MAQLFCKTVVRLPAQSTGSWNWPIFYLGFEAPSSEIMLNIVIRLLCYSWECSLFGLLKYIYNLKAIKHFKNDSAVHSPRKAVPQQQRLNLWPILKFDGERQCKIILLLSMTPVLQPQASHLPSPRDKSACLQFFAMTNSKFWKHTCFHASLM